MNVCVSGGKKKQFFGKFWVLTKWIIPHCIPHQNMKEILDRENFWITLVLRVQLKKNQKLKLAFLRCNKSKILSSHVVLEKMHTKTTVFAVRNFAQYYVCQRLQNEERLGVILDFFSKSFQIYTKKFPKFIKVAQ